MTIERAIPFLLTTVLLIGCAKQPQAEAPAPQPASSPTTAAAPTTDASVKGFKIGVFSAMALADGGMTVPNDAKTIGIGHSSEEIAELLSAAGVSTTELSLDVHPLLVKAGDRVLLFDTGAGKNMGASVGKLHDSMKQAGVDPARVTDIFISHVHGDHVGGLVDANGALAFPNATIHLSKPEWEFLKALGEQGAAKVGINNYAAFVAAITPKIAAFAPGSDLIPGVVKAVEIKGHTPGHSGYRITSGADSVLYIGDTAHHYIVSVQKPDWTIAFDTDAPTAQASRKELIAQSAASGQRIYAVHFPFPGVGRFEKQGDGYVWKAEPL